MVGISVDDPAKNAAMVEKLQLPFPLLSDPDGAKAIKPYDVWHEGKGYARPAVVVVSPDGEQVVRQVGGEFSDRISEPELVDRIRNLGRDTELGLDSVKQAPPDTQQPEPGDEAFPMDSMVPYFTGARFAAIALGVRAPDAKEQADALRDQAQRYVEAAKTLRA